METKNTLTTVLRLMDDLRPAAAGMFQLFAINKQLQLTNSKQLPPTAEFIAMFSQFQMNNGLTSEQWNNLDAKIRTLIHKGVLK